MRIPFSETGAIGVLSGVPPHEVPAPAWTAGQNVRMVDGAVHKFLGHASVFGTPSVVPYWLLPVQTASIYYWIYPSLTKCYVTDGATHYNITRQTASVDVDYTASALSRWNGCVLNGIPILNNGVDDPQMWLPVSTAQRLQMLSNWPASTKANIIRSFKNFLIALDVTKASTRYPYLVKWSHPADLGAVPISWNEADVTKDTGEVSLSETPDFLVDCLPLRDVNIIYKESTTWIMQYVGGAFVFRFAKLFGEFGLLTRDCASEFFGKHFVATREDIVIHDGQQANSIFDTAERKKMAATLFNSIDQTNISRCFTVAQFGKQELWFCYPEVGSTYCNKALVFNYKKNALGIRDLPNLNYARSGIVSPGETTTWDSDTATWDSDTGVWDGRIYSATQSHILGAGTADTLLYNFDNTNTNNGTNMTSYVERTQLPLAQENVKSGVTQRYLLREVWPRMRATGPVNIYVGGQEKHNTAVTWTGPFSYNPATDNRILCRVNTPLPAIKIESTTNVHWELDGFVLDAVPAGSY